MVSAVLWELKLTNGNRQHVACSSISFEGMLYIQTKFHPFVFFSNALHTSCAHQSEMFINTVSKDVFGISTSTGKALI